MIIDGQQLIHGDCLMELKNLESDSIDSIVTDPPYELGFMNKHWDNTGIAYNVDLWKECLRVLKPGGHLLSFGGTRTYHRMTCAIEDAGFEIRDMIEWVYGSGFPKSLAIGKAIDNLQGNEREVVGTQNSHDIRSNGLLDKKGHFDREVTKGSSDWEGWGTALKPAHEPICLARKPISEKNIALNVLKWGTGGLNIDESRIELCRYDIEEYIPNRVGYKNGLSHMSKLEHNKGFCQGSRKNQIQIIKPSGRFPANLIHDGSDEVKACFPETHSSASPNTKGRQYKIKDEWQHLKGMRINMGNQDNGDKGGNASRFFKSIIYTSKASPSERGDNDHPTVKPVELMKYLIKLITPKNGVVLDPFSGSFTTGVACNQLGFKFVGIEKELEYYNIGCERMKANRNLFLEVK